MINVDVGYEEIHVKKLLKNTIGCNEFTIVKNDTINATKVYKYDWFNH